MQLTRLLAAGYLTGSALAWPAHLRRGVDCGFSTTADSGATCESFASSWGLSVDDLKNLNPGITCPNLDTSNEYCVIGTVTDDPITTSTPVTTTTSATTKPATTTTSATRPTTSSTTTKASTTTTAGNGVATPMPTQPGMVSNCNKFYYVEKGTNCGQVLDSQKISLGDFAKWNPSVNNDCSGLWAEVNVCVGVIGGGTPVTTAKPSTTTSAGNGVQTPQPTQPGMVSNCNKFYYVPKGSSCSQVLSSQKIALTDFAKWNPSVNNDCSGLWAEVNVCVGVIGGTPATTTTKKPTTTTSAGNGIQTPQPTQPGMVSNCRKFHYVSKGDTCQQIISYEKITLANFVKWNTGVGSNCQSMWAETNVCVGV